MVTALLSGPAHWLSRLLKFWALCALITLAAMLAHTSDNPRFFGRYSTLVFLMLLGLAIGTVAGFVGSVILQRDPRHVEQIERHLVKWRTKAWFAPLGLTAACSLLILLWFFFLGDHLETYVVLRLFLGFTILLTTLGVIMGGDTSGTGVKINYLVLGTIGLIFVAAVIVGNFYPVYHPDETLIMGMLRNFADTGNAGPLLYRFTTPTNYIGRGLWIWIMSNWLNLVGFSQTTARLYTLLVGYAALPFIWGTAARLYNRSVAWLAVMLSAFGIALFNYIRPDTSTILLFSIALYCYVLGRNNNRLWLHLLTGLFVSLAVDSEPIAFTFGLGFFVVYFLDYLKQIRNHRKWLWWPIIFLIIGGLLGIGFYGVTRAGTTFLKGGYSVLSRNTPANTGEAADPASMVKSYLIDGFQRLTEGSFIGQAQNVLSTAINTQPILFALTILGIGTAIYDRTESDIFLLVMLGVWLVVIIFTFFYFPPFYILHVLPILSILAARGLERGVSVVLGNSASAGSLFVVTAAVIVTVWFGAVYLKGVIAASGNHFPEQIEISRQISRLIPKDSVVVAAAPYYFGMLENRGFVGAETEIAMIDFFQMSPDDVWPTIKPDAVVFSSAWPTLPSHNPQLLAYMNDHVFSMVRCWQTVHNVHVELWMDKLPNDIKVQSNCITVK